VGIVIAGTAEIGDNVRIYQNVTIGRERGTENVPSIGDNAVIYSGAVIVRDVQIGDGAVIGANSVVLDDVPEDTIVAGVPAAKIKAGDVSSHYTPRN
jgi:serine O-acetyltransferase